MAFILGAYPYFGVSVGSGEDQEPYFLNTNTKNLALQILIFTHLSSSNRETAQQNFFFWSIQ